MDPKLFEALGKYAGLAGICVGLVLLVFLAILKKNTSPGNLSLVKQMMYLTFFIGFSALAHGCSSSRALQSRQKIPALIAPCRINLSPRLRLRRK
jgi:hypothetical protein